MAENEPQNIGDAEREAAIARLQETMKNGSAAANKTTQALINAMRRNSGTPDAPQPDDPEQPAPTAADEKTAASTPVAAADAQPEFPYHDQLDDARTMLAELESQKAALQSEQNMAERTHNIHNPQSRIGRNRNAFEPSPEALEKIAAAQDKIDLATKHVEKLEDICGVNLSDQALQDKLDHLRNNPTDGALSPLLEESMIRKQDALAKAENLNAHLPTSIPDNINPRAQEAQQLKQEIDALTQEQNAIHDNEMAVEKGTVIAEPAPTPKPKDSEGLTQDDGSMIYPNGAIAATVDAAGAFNTAGQNGFSQTNLNRIMQAGLKALGADIKFDGKVLPDDHNPDTITGETVQAMEKFLGVQAAGNPLTPQEISQLVQDNIGTLKEAVAKSPEAQARIAAMAQTPGENTRELQAALNLVSDEPVAIDGVNGAETEIAAQEAIDNVPNLPEVAPKSEPETLNIGVGSKGDIKVIDNPPVEKLSEIHDSNNDAQFEQALYDRLPALGPNDSAPENMPPELAALSHLKYAVETTKEMAQKLPADQKEQAIKGHQDLYDKAYEGIYTAIDDRAFEKALDYMDQNHLPGTGPTSDVGEVMKVTVEKAAPGLV